MEDLRNTEVLDREILEDARRKAQKILSTADKAIKKAESAWERRKTREINALTTRLEEEVNAEKEELSSQLPLEKRRLRSAWAHSALNSALADWLTSLSYAEQSELLFRELEPRLKAFPKEARLSVYSHALKKEDLLRKLTDFSLDFYEKPSAFFIESQGRKQKTSLFASTGADSLPILRIESGDLAIRLSIVEIAERILSFSRADLAVALLGEGVIND